MTTIVPPPPVGMTSATTVAAAQPAAAAQQSPMTQNLTEYLAKVNPGRPASGASPSQLGEDMIANLRGFFDRSQSMVSRARALTDPTPAPRSSMTLAHRGPAQQALDPGAVRLGPQPAAGAVDGQQMDRVINALSMMFDYSVETQLVVRGATQVSGAANTLLRGQ